MDEKNLKLLSWEKIAEDNLEILKKSINALCEAPYHNLTTIKNESPAITPFDYHKKSLLKTLYYTRTLKDNNEGNVNFC